MKHILSFILCAFVSLNVFAQDDVTKFMGIPIDGFKNDMRRKIEAKGFQWNSIQECFEGEFNGTDVKLSLVTNNNKVYRVFLQDAVYRDEQQIILRFNKLCSQFAKNNNYCSLSDTDQTIPEDEDISYEMTVHKKRYEAAFYQNPGEIDSLKVQQEIYSRCLNEFSEAELAAPTEEVQQRLMRIALEYSFEILSQKTVWFVIDERYGQYGILMYYDNKKNEANGDDL